MLTRRKRKQRDRLNEKTGFKTWMQQSGKRTLQARVRFDGGPTNKNKLAVSVMSKVFYKRYKGTYARRGWRDASGDYIFILINIIIKIKQTANKL